MYRKYKNGSNNRGYGLSVFEFKRAVRNENRKPNSKLKIFSQHFSRGFRTNEFGIRRTLRVRAADEKLPNSAGRRRNRENPSFRRRFDSCKPAERDPRERKTFSFTTNNFNRNGDEFGIFRLNARCDRATCKILYFSFLFFFSGTFRARHERIARSVLPRAASNDELLGRRI